MLGLEPRAVRITWSVLLMAGVAVLIYEARRTILIFLLAVFFAYLLAPILSLVDRFLKGRLGRTLTLMLVYVVMIAVLITVVVAVGTRASQEAANLIARMPDLAKSAGKISSVPLPPWLEPLRGQVLNLIQEQVESGLEKALPLLKSTITQLLSYLGSLGFAILIPILSFFFLKDAEELRNTVVRLVNREESRQYVSGLLSDVHEMLGHYIRALFLLSLATFIAFIFFFQIAEVPYTSLLATIAALLEFIPVLGPLSAATIACIVALISGYPHIGWMIVFFIVYRMFQDYVLQPFLLGSGLALHPLMIVFGALAGEQIAGIPGMLFSVPVMATLRLMYVRSRRSQ